MAGMFQKDDVHLVSEENSPEVIRAIDDFFTVAEPDDTLLFYYSGHGRTLSQQLYLCAGDTIVDRLHSTAISEATLNAIVASSLAQVKILVLDCCHSGMLKGSDIIEGLSGTGRYIIAAASAIDRASDASARGMPSPFTRVLTEALISKADDRNGDGHADLDDVYSYLEKVRFEGPRPYRVFDGSGAIPIARRSHKPAPGLVGEDVLLATTAKGAGGQHGVTTQFTGLKAPNAYLDTAAPDATYSPERVAEFRGLLRDDVAEKMPGQLTAEEFLARAGLLKQGHLTYAGALLFGNNPTAILPTAMVECVRFGDTTKMTLLERVEFQGTVPEMIVGAREFVAKSARLGEAPTSQSAYAEVVYKYPMIAVREIIANAIVHRDYEEQESCVQVLAFADRIEVISPGRWVGTDVAAGESLLSQLERQSQRRNFRLARTLTWSRLVEGVGAGVTRAVADCRAVGAPEPMVLNSDRMVAVKIFPRTAESIIYVGRDVSTIARQSDNRLYLWTAADFRAGLESSSNAGEPDLIEPGELVDVTSLRQGRLPNLQLEFARLGQEFDKWLAPGPSRKRGQKRLRVLWLVGESGPDRSKALLACLSRAGEHGRAVYDAGRDLDAAAAAVSQFILSAGSTLPPLIAADLGEDQAASPWGIVETAVRNVARQSAGRDGRHPREEDPYPRMIVAGTVEQEEAAAGSLPGLVDVTPVDRRGIVQQRDYALRDQVVTSHNVYNRGLPITARKLVGRKRELETFRRAWESEQTRVLWVVGYGGTGKSALVNAWLNEMQDKGYDGAQKVLAWSFYSQGTKENLVSADLFVNTALGWLGDDSPPSLNLWARGLRLASLIKRERFLLVLDGLEPLQYPLSAPHVGGRITDDSIRALIEELAKPDWQGLCLITTRVPLTDLGRFQAEGAGSGDRDPGAAGAADQSTVERLDLENLNERDGADLLQDLIRREADFRELQAAVREVEGHALAITLLGNYLRDVHSGDLAGRFDLDRLTVEVREGGHARRIMATYAAWLERNERLPELTVLRLIGLFDRPAEPEAMKALLADPRMRTFTGELEQGTNAWNGAADALRAMGLLNREFPDLPGTLDAHPLVREHFRDQLRTEHETWWLQGNRTLFDFYLGQAPPQPDDSRGMNMLYAAVTHGCAAELYQQVIDDVLLERIWRDRRTNFSTRRLGMTGSDLVALSNFFYPRQWTVLRTPSLTPRARVLVLTNAGVRLRQLGRLVDARDCFGAVVREIDPQQARAEELEDASYAAAQYCELLVIAGKLTGGADESEGALFNGQRAVEYSDRGGDSYFSMHARSSLAEVFFMLNDLAQADALFEQAMAIERGRRPRPPFLYSQGLYRYGYYLIETGRAEAILTGHAQDPSWGKNGEDSSLLSEAIRLLILGAAHRALIEAGNRAPAFLVEGERILNEAIGAFQTAGYTDYTVRGLLERAHFYRALRDTRSYASALTDLARAASEADRGQMNLLYADVLLQQVACYLDFWPVMTTPQRSSIRGKITDGIAEADRLVTAIGYGRRQAMLAGLEETVHGLGLVDQPGQNSPSRPEPHGVNG